MSVYAGPEIVSANVVFYVDFANPKSISGTTATDLSYKQIPISLINASNNTLSTANGYAEFSPESPTTQSTYYQVSNTFFNDIRNEMTLETVVWANTTPSGGNRIVSPRITETGSPLGFGLNPTTISCEVNVTVGWRTAVYGVGKGSNTWVHVVQTTSNTANAMTTYVNTVNVGLLTIPGTLANGGGILIGRGYYGGTNYPAGRVSYVKVYDKVLSPAEIVQNFNALRGRFNI